MFFGDDDDFPGGHPFGGGFGGFPGMGQPRERKPVDTTSLYKALESEKTDAYDVIRKKYRKLAAKHHPDKPGGDKEKFQEIQNAWDIIGDKEKRDLYDKHGEEGVKQGGGPGGGGDIFSQMFGGGRGGGPSGPQKMKSVKHEMKCTLEEIFNGKKTKIAINRERICAKCDGKGGKEGAVQKCPKCRGRGMVMKMQQLGPGMYTQSQGPCDDCRGKGEIIDEANKCKTCNGKKVTKEKKVIEVDIDKGAPNGYKYTLHGEADESPGAEAGDVVILVNEQPHKQFKRKGADLLVERKVNLVDALTGVDFCINHLDGSQLRIKSTPGEVIKPDDLKTVIGKGLPFHKRSFDFGNLYVKFTIVFPDSMSKPQLTALNSALNK